MPKKTLEERLEDLETFQNKIETGSAWIKYMFYAAGGFVIFLMSAYEFFLRHINFK